MIQDIFTEKWWLDQPENHGISAWYFLGFLAALKFSTTSQKNVGLQVGEHYDNYGNLWMLTGDRTYEHDIVDDY
jgi:hypothetical protein